MNLAALHRHARRRLAAAGLDTPDLDARLIVEHVSGTSRTDAALRPDLPIASDVVAAIESALARRLGGEPVHRILGHREFYGLRLALSPATLEPRPDTETLVDALLPFVRRTVAEQDACRILDLGTGTGAIALALLAEVPGATAVGVDMSAGALETAAANAAALGLAARFSTVRSDWFAEIDGRYHAIASNPPYIDAEEMAALSPEVAGYDPRTALYGGPDGLDAYRSIAAGAARHLEPGGRVGVEIGHRQRDRVMALFQEAGYGLEAARQDLAGRDRVLIFRR